MCSYDPRKAGRDTKSLKAKNSYRVTLHGLVPMPLVQKVHIAFAFQDSPPPNAPIHYTHQSNDWLDREKLVQALVV